MKIKFQRKSKFNFLSYILNKNFFYKFYFFFTIICFILFCFIFFQMGIWDKNKKEFLKRINLNGIVNYKYLTQIIYYKINSIFEKQNEIYIDINQKNLIKIENNRKEIIKLSKQIIPFEKATAFVLYNNKRLKSEIRLKGDRDIHFRERNSSSYRIDINRGEVFDEMKKFSIQKPRIRNYLHEWIFHELLGQGGLVKVKYDFYNFHLNGKYLGYYSLEESFGKVMLERNKRRNGPIFSTFEDINAFSDKNKYEVYNKKYWEKPENIIIVKSALQKLSNFLDGNEPLENTFDLEKWAWFFAVTDLTYTYHGTLIKSVKLYYNPISGKFEPIGFDGHRLAPNYSEHITQEWPILKDTNFLIASKKKSQKEKFTKGFEESIEKDFFFQNDKLNKNFYKYYVEAIRKISNQKFLDSFFDTRKKKINKINSGIYRDSYVFDYNSRRKSGIGIYYFKKREIYRRAEFLLREFSLKKAAMFIEEGQNELIFNSYDYNNIFLSNGKILCKNYKINLDQLKFNDKVLYLKKSNKFNSTCNKVFFKDSISGNYIEYKINKYNSFDNNVKPAKYNFLEFFEKKNNKLFLKNKSSKINKNLFIPHGYEVILKGGDEIILGNNSFIFSNSNWTIGDLNQKTYIRGNKENLGGGIIIYDNKKNSHVINCEFKYLTGLKKNNISNDNNFYKERIIMGALNFFQTNVTIENSSFSNIYSEDAVNIVSSNYLIKNSYFKNVKSDAIDIDFSDGKITNSNFLNIGNDAIDFSGSKSEISFIDFKEVVDKGISIGENSFIKLNNINGKASLVGIASKDGSKAFANNITFLDIDYPFTAYQKKKAYNNGQLFIENYSINNFKRKFINDSISIIFDNKSKKEIGKNNPNIDRIIKNII